MSKFDCVAIETVEQAKKYREEWIEKFGEKKTVYSREDVVNQTAEPTDYPIEGCTHVTDQNQKEAYDLVVEAIKENQNLDILTIKEYVVVPEAIVDNIKNNTKIPSMADDNMRKNYERYTGEVAEMAMVKLAEASDLDIKVLPDDNHVHAGDFLVEGYITELKSINATHSKGANIVIRNHTQDNTAEMMIKNAVYPEALVHSYVVELDGDILVGFGGITHTHPETDGLLTQTPYTIDWCPYFALYNPHKVDWVGFSKIEVQKNRDKFKKFDYSSF